MLTHARSFVLALALAAAWARLLPSTSAFAQMGAGGYAGPAASFSPGGYGAVGIYNGAGIYGGIGGYGFPYFNLPRPVFRPTIGLPPWPLSVPMGEGGIVFGQQFRQPALFTGNMRPPFAGLALVDTGAGVNWTPVYNCASSWPGLPPSMAWPWWGYSPAGGWAPTPYYAQRYVGGRWVPIAP